MAMYVIEALFPKRQTSNMMNLLWDVMRVCATESARSIKADIIEHPNYGNVNACRRTLVLETDAPEHGETFAHAMSLQTSLRSHIRRMRARGCHVSVCLTAFRRAAGEPAIGGGSGHTPFGSGPAKLAAL